jgi:2-haloacid dehalogenase
VAFDVVGTLFALDPIGVRLRDAGLPEAALGEWFARFLRDVMALDTAGMYVPFREVATATLEAMLIEHGQPASQTTIDSVLQAFAELPARSDVRPPFQRLREAGVRIVTLSNDSAAATERLLVRSKVDDFVERIFPSTT